MKHFKKKGFWVFYVALVLAGAFIIVALGLQNQSPVIPNVSAQGFAGYNPQGGGLFTTPTAGYHPGGIIFPVPTKPGDDGSDGGGEMRTIMTCGGCNQTMSTCDWQCGATFTQCGSRGGQGSMFGLFGENYTSGICTGIQTSGICTGIPTSGICTGIPTSGICIGTPTSGICIGTPTSGICTGIQTSGICIGIPTSGICIGIPTSGICTGTQTSGICIGTPTSGICIGTEYPTSSTCGFICGGGGISTFMTCSGSLFGSCGGGISGITSSTCGAYGVGCVSEPEKKYGPIGLTRGTSCGTWMMHAMPGGLVSEFSQSLAY